MRLNEERKKLGERGGTKGATALLCADATCLGCVADGDDVVVDEAEECFGEGEADVFFAGGEGAAHAGVDVVEVVDAEVVEVVEVSAFAGYDHGWLPCVFR